MAEDGTHEVTVEDYRAALEKEAILGSECTNCGHRQITFMAICPQCQHRSFKPFEASGTGTIASFTHQQVSSALYKDHIPYAYVIVDFGDGVRTSGWMAVKSADELEVGKPVRFVKKDAAGALFEFDE